MPLEMPKLTRSANSRALMPCASGEEVCQSSARASTGRSTRARRVAKRVLIAPSLRLQLRLVHDNDCIFTAGSGAKSELDVASQGPRPPLDRKSTRLNSSHPSISYAV